MSVLNKMRQHRFLFEELVKRDFKKKYKGAALGMLWSVLSPLFQLLVMKIVFTQFFGQAMPNYTTYLFCGLLVFTFFSEATNQGMSALLSNAGIFTKVNVPKYLFLLSKNTQTLLNFFLMLGVFFIFCALDHVEFTWKLVFLAYPISMLVLFNLGMGLILSALLVFFRDVQYLWGIAMQMIMYLSAVFYVVDMFPEHIQCLFMCNPIYLFITYFRMVVMHAQIPGLELHGYILAYVAGVLSIGSYMYKKYNTRFLYYV